MPICTNDKIGAEAESWPRMYGKLITQHTGRVHMLILARQHVQGPTILCQGRLKDSNVVDGRNQALIVISQPWYPF